MMSGPGEFYVVIRPSLDALDQEHEQRYGSLSISFYRSPIQERDHQNTKRLNVCVWLSSVG